MTEPFAGNIEIINEAGESYGLPGVAWSPEAVPSVVSVVAGIADLQPVDPEPAQTGRVPEASWSGVDRAGLPVQVHLWRDIPYEETEIAKAIAEAIAAEGGS